MIWVRSALFALWFWGASLVLNIVFLPTLLLPRRFVGMSERIWARSMIWGLRVFAGIRYEVRGRENIPKSACLIASKHHTAWETLIFPLVLDDPTLVVKRELLFIPVYGWYLMRAGMISIDRAAHAKALRKLIADARAALLRGRSVIIFPEGTRVSPGTTGEYKPGVAALYGKLDVPCLPVAVNSGAFWPRRSFIKRPGTIVLEFLSPIPPGFDRKRFMAELETRIEAATNRLLAEAGLEFGQAQGQRPSRAGQPKTT